MGVETLGNLPFDAVESPSADKEDIFGVDRNHLLLGMLAPSLRGDVHHRSFKKFKETLLHTLAGNVAGNRRIVTLAGNLVYLVDEDDTTLSLGHIIISYLEQACQQALDILADITSLGKHGRVNDGERHIKHPRDGLGEESLAGAGGADQDYVALLDINIPKLPFATFLLGETLVMVIDRDRKVALGAVLSYHILVKEVTDFFGLGQRGQIETGISIASQTAGRLTGTYLMAVVGQQLMNLVGAFGAEIHPGLDS